jgi:hypothetical protein
MKLWLIIGHAAYKNSEAVQNPNVRNQNGPTLKLAGKHSQRTFLFALLDDHSRLCVHGQFYPAERTECLLDCLRPMIVNFDHRCSHRLKIRQEDRIRGARMGVKNQRLAWTRHSAGSRPKFSSPLRFPDRTGEDSPFGQPPRPSKRRILASDCIRGGDRTFSLFIFLGRLLQIGYGRAQA